MKTAQPLHADDDFIDEACDNDADDDEEQTLAADHSQANGEGGLLAMEGMLLDPSLAVARDTFCQQHCKEAQGATESQQHQLFKRFQDVMQDAFSQQQRLPSGSDGPVITLLELAQQLQQLEEHSCSEEVEELLLSVSDLGAFLALLEDFRQAEAEREAGGGGLLELQGSKAGLHAEEQEDGEERPDLDRGLSVTGLTAPAL